MEVKMSFFPHYCRKILMLFIYWCCALTISTTSWIFLCAQEGNCYASVLTTGTVKFFSLEMLGYCNSAFKKLEQTCLVHLLSLKLKGNKDCNTVAYRTEVIIKKQTAKGGNSTIITGINVVKIKEKRTHKIGLCLCFGGSISSAHHCSLKSNHTFQSISLLMVHFVLSSRSPTWISKHQPQGHQGTPLI